MQTCFQKLVFILDLSLLVGCVSLTEPTPNPSPTSSPTTTATPLPSVTPTPTPGVRAVVTEKTTAISRGAAYCNTLSSVLVDGENHPFCTYRDPDSFVDVSTLDETVTGVLSDPNGDSLEVNPFPCDSSYRHCPAFLWEGRNKTGVIYALPRLWPYYFNGTQVAPVLLTKKDADPSIMTNWRIVLVDRNSGNTLTEISNPWSQLSDQDVIEFNPDSGFLEGMRQSGGGLTAIGVRLGLELMRPALPIGAVAGIPFYQFPAEDMVRYTNLLEWLKRSLPNWHQYILDRRPMKIYWNPSLRNLGWGGRAFCCTASNLGSKTALVELGPRPTGDLAIDLWHLSAIVHESTHVRDLRAGMGNVINLTLACRTEERSAVEQEAEFLQDVLNSNADGRTKSTAISLLIEARGILAKGTFDWNPSCR
jgi:hypothetical protein